MDKPAVVSVRIPGAELRRLQLIAQVYARSVGELIRDAVAKYVDELIHADDFESKAISLKRRNDETLSELLANSDPATESPIVGHLSPRRTSTAPRSGASHPVLVAEPPRDIALTKVEIEASFGKAEIGAAASHAGRSRSQASRWRSSFMLAWKQGEQEWAMEGRLRDDVSEVVLTGTPNVPEGPRFIEWKNSKTGSTDRFPVTSSADGRYLVNVLLSKARRRAEAVRDADDAAKQVDALPVVRLK